MMQPFRCCFACIVIHGCSSAVNAMPSRRQSMLQSAASSWVELPTTSPGIPQQPLGQGGPPSDSESPASTPYRLSPEPSAAEQGQPGLFAALVSNPAIKSAKRKAAEALLAARHASGSPAAPPPLTSAGAAAAAAWAAHAAASSSVQERHLAAAGTAAINMPRERASKRKRGDAAATLDPAAAGPAADDSVLVRACRDSAACCAFMRQTEAAAEDGTVPGAGSLAQLVAWRPKRTQDTHTHVQHPVLYSRV